MLLGDVTYRLPFTNPSSIDSRPVPARVIASPFGGSPGDWPLKYVVGEIVDGPPWHSRSPVVHTVIGPVARSHR